MKISVEKDLEKLFGPLFKRGINRKARRRKGKKATNHKSRILNFSVSKQFIYNRSIGVGVF